MNNYCQRVNYQILPIYNGTYLECWAEMKRLENKYWDDYYSSIKVITSDSIDIQMNELTFT